MPCISSTLKLIDGYRVTICIVSQSVISIKKKENNLIFIKYTTVRAVEIISVETESFSRCPRVVVQTEEFEST